MVSMAPPSPLGGLMTDIAKSVAQTVTASSDNSGVLSAIVNEGMVHAGLQAQSAQTDSFLGRVVRTLVEARLNSHFLTGMCPRNYTVPCPPGYEPTTEEGSEKVILCTLSSMDETTPVGCSTMDPSTAKEEFALRCGTQWPCAACTRNFTACPLGWTAVEAAPGSCQSPFNYTGLCPGVIDFTRMKTGIDKARWAASCGDKWPCQPE
jgi:CPW-WPC domain-containing protein